MSGQTLEDYFRLFNLDETRRQYLENIKEGKQVDRAIEEQLFKNGNGEQHSLIAEHRYSIYMKRFVIHRHQHWAPITSYR
jgi:zona occludens toxin (predicted ATPase)